MIQRDATYVVMGLLDSDSIAYAIGKAIGEGGGKVIFTVQSARMKKIFFDRNKALDQEVKDALDIRFCDITQDEEIEALFADIGPIAGVVHSIAYANPKTCLGPEFHTDAYDDLKTGFHISAVSLASVTRYAVPNMPDGGAVVALSFASEIAFAYYNWMHVNKAALEATVRGLARRHGRDYVRVNAISAGPLSTKAAGAIPGFKELGNTWERMAPIPWNPETDKEEVANAALFLIGPCSRKISGQVLYVDGGASIVGGELLPHEKPGGPVPGAE
jgi:enoyl-[acyl-carrier protein] reductase I